jgi:kinetochore protein NNF1
MTSWSWHVYFCFQRRRKATCIYTTPSIPKLPENRRGYTGTKPVIYGIQQVSRMDAHSRESPSPAPEAPVASTPGPRATALQKVFTGALSASIKANSYANFSSCFPTPAMYCPGALEGAWGQVNSRLEQECMREFEQILGDRHVVEGLNQWETMIDEARKNKHRAVDTEMLERP